MIKDFKSSKGAHLATLGAMFAIMLIFNILTKLLADDFQYYFSFATGKPIESFKDSIDSIITHGKYLNGRYFSHYVAQACLRLPPVAFDLINSAVFVATVYAVYLISNRRRGFNNYLLIGIFGAVWLFEQDFGQVNLWLDGSCNYLFAIFFGLIYIFPFVRSLLYGKKVSPWIILPHVLISFWFGGYLEMTSAGFVCASCLFILADVCLYKNYRSLLFIPSVISAFCGFLLIVLAPAQTVNKVSEFSFINVLTTFGVALLMLASIFPIIILYIALYKRALKEKTDRRVLISSLIMGISALAANFVMVFAKYYALRCSIAFIFMSIFATAILYGSLKNTEPSPRAKKFVKLFGLALVLAIAVGLADNIATFAIIEEHEAIIEEAIEEGEGEVELCRPVPVTKYNGLWGLRYLDIRDPDGWPNIYYARYYGIERIRATSVFGDLFGFW